MVVLYIRDHGGMGFSGQKKSHKNQLHNTILVPWQYWVGISKPKSAFSMTLNASNKCDLILENCQYLHNFQNSFYLFFVAYRDRGIEIAKFQLHKLSSVGNTALDSWMSK